MNRHLLIILAFILSALSIHAQSDSNLLEKSYEAYGKMKYDDAITYCLKIIDTDPTNISAHWNCALAYYNINCYPQALYHYKKAAELSPSSISFGNLGGFLGQMGYSEEALEAFDQAILLDKEHTYALARASKGAVFMHIEKYDEALKYTQEAIEANPNYSTSYLNLYLIYDRLGDKEKSKEYLLKYTKLTPKCITGQILKTEELLSPQSDDYQRNLKEIINECSDILQTNRYSNYILTRANLYNMLGKEDLARKDYLQALKIYDEAVHDMPDSWKMYKTRAQIYMNMKEYDKAMSDYKRVLEIRPNLKTIEAKIEELNKLLSK